MASLRCGPGQATARPLENRAPLENQAPGAKHDPLADRVRSSATADSTTCLPGAGREPSQASPVLCVGVGVGRARLCTMPTIADREPCAPEKDKPLKKRCNAAIASLYVHARTSRVISRLARLSRSHHSPSTVGPVHCSSA